MTRILFLLRQSPTQFGRTCSTDIAVATIIGAVMAWGILG